MKRNPSCDFGYSSIPCRGRVSKVELSISYQPSGHGGHHLLVEAKVCVGHQEMMDEGLHQVYLADGEEKRWRAEQVGP